VPAQGPGSRHYNHTMFVDLTLGEHLQIWGKRRGGGICDTQPAISLKRSSLERNTTECV